PRGRLLDADQGRAAALRRAAILLSGPVSANDCGGDRRTRIAPDTYLTSRIDLDAFPNPIRHHPMTSGDSFYGGIPVFRGFTSLMDPA
ncbi:hypothetical protein ACMWQD_28535, partial [Escherichia coli]|uniref:hypothetical protein n=1 Tax=Escherichia coli TaxID=562 RepID=UPI0039E11639